MEEEINHFLEKNGSLFPTFNLSGRAISIANCPPQWKAPKTEEKSNNPGFLFYTQPSKLLVRDYAQGVTSCSPKISDSNFFNFEQKENDTLSSLSFQEKLDNALPLASIYQNKPPSAIFDKRVDVGKQSAGEIRNVFVQFKELSSFVEIVGPVIINCFLYDIDSKQRVSETWRFLPPKLRDQPGANDFVSKYIREAPTEINFPFASNNNKAASRIIFVVSLDRLFLKDGGSSVDKYMVKPNESTRKSAITDIKKCNQPEVLQTFGWSFKPFSEMVPYADSHTIEIDNFTATSIVSDELIAKETELGFNRSKNKVLSLRVSFQVHATATTGTTLQHFYSFAHSLQSEEFQNKLFININRTKFRFPRNIRSGRNIIVNIQIVSNNKPLPVFHGSEKYVSRVQYHEENPYFYDEAIADLPIDLPKDAEIFFSFWHASVKTGASAPIEKCGNARFPLFQNGAFVEDGKHSQYIDYGVETDTSENNRVYFETNLFSSVFSSDPQVENVLSGNLKIKAPKIKLLMQHLYSVLDALIKGIENDDPNAFESLLEILSLFDKQRNASQNHPLIFYIKYAALRGETNEFYKHCSKQWLAYIKKNEKIQVRPDITGSWFLFELIVKSLALSKTPHDLSDLTEVAQQLSGKLHEYRNKQVAVGLTLNITLVQFFKDIIEVSSREVGFKMLSNHLDKVELLAQRYDRECFRDVLSNFLTPKIFLFSLMDIDGDSKGKVTYFDKYIISRIQEAFPVEQHTNMVFQILYQVLSQYSIEQNDFIHFKLKRILHAVEKNIDTIKNYKNRANHVYIFAICHYVFYYLMRTKNGISEKWTNIASLMLHYAVHLRGEARAKVIKDAEMQDNSSEDLTKKMLVDVKEETKQLKVAGARKFCSLKQTRKTEIVSKPLEKFEITRIFDALAFCTQSVFIKPIIFFDAVYVVNNIISPYFDIELSPYIQSDVYEAIAKFIEARPLTFFCGKNTSMKHIVCKIIKSPNIYNVGLLDRMGKTEKKTKIPNGIEYTNEAEYKKLENLTFTENEDKRTKSMVARALFKSKLTDESVELLKKTMYGDYVESFYNIDKDLTPKMKEDNPDIYADLLLQKLKLLEPSPDARLEVLLQLHEHQFATQYKSEALMAQLCAAALVAEFLHHFKRIPDAFFSIDHPALKFENACPPAVKMMVPDNEIESLPKMPGFCTSKYFSEFGLIYLIQVSMDSAKAADLFELSTRIHGLLNPIAQHRHLWKVLQKHYITGQLSWLIAERMYTSSDRRLGSYYKVEFPDTGVYIYRETVLTNLWQVCAKIQKSSLYYSKGKEVVVVSEGQELDRQKYNDPDKYYVHVKFVNQYFTPDDRQKRMTVFEQNHNINQFYFDVPFSKSSQSGLEHCYLKRTIFTLPCPLPYLISRVHVPKENIEKITFEPIEYAVQNLQSQVSKIREACARVRLELQAVKPGDDTQVQSFKELQPLIQGSLLVQVNEGPEKMAEVFLTGDENVHQAELREVFRDFISANTYAVKLHGEMVMKFPVYAVLQEELELGLSKLTSKLQQYLK